MKKTLFIFIMSAAVLSAMLVCSSLDTRKDLHAEKTSDTVSGHPETQGCTKCHFRFMDSWSGTSHSLTLQKYEYSPLKRSLNAPAKDLIIGNYRYRIVITPQKGLVQEKGSMPWSKKEYGIEYMLKGSHVVYLLTFLEKGRLQILPAAYDLEKKEWFDVTAEGLKHTGARGAYWNEPAYTFTTNCFGCHVSTVSSYYDQKTENYSTAFYTPGIACDACHGSSEEHMALFRNDTQVHSSQSDMKIVRLKKVDPVLVSRTCAPCHAGMKPITSSYKPGEDLFDHYDLASLEDHGLAQAGSDLDPAHTYTRWLMSPCLGEGRMGCLSCHTPGGGYRFRGKSLANNACLPCHKDVVRNSTGHTHHQPGSDGDRCVSCHMPKIAAGRMQITDHSMQPPIPAATLAFGYPNACNTCHNGKDASWADKIVRKRYGKDYQTFFLKRSALVESAARRDWTGLDDMLSYIRNKDRNEIIAVSLIRSLGSCPIQSKTPVLIDMLSDPSPLVRASAAMSLEGVMKPRAVRALAAATEDPVRLVRIKAAAVLTKYPAKVLKGSEVKNLEAATAEYITSMMVQPDLWTSYSDMGDYFLERGEYKDALMAYGTALRIEPKAVGAMVGSAQAYLGLRDRDKAEARLIRALQLEPGNAAAHYQMGILRKDKGKTAPAEESFRTALRYDPSMYQAAYKLCLLLAEDRIKEAIAWGQKAFKMYPDTKTGSTLATLLKKDGNWDGAIEVLKQVMVSDSTFADAYLLLGEIYESRAKKRDAQAVYRKGLESEGMEESDRNRIQARLNRLLL